MLQMSVKYLEGLNFHWDIKIVEPREKQNGVYVEFIDRNLLRQSPELAVIFKAIGLHKVDEHFESFTDVYAWGRWGKLRFSLIRLLILAYWRTLYFLYDNGRVFKEIPPGQCFSWRYFTPYTWLRFITSKLAKKQQS